VPFCNIEEEKIEKYRLERGDIVIARMADPGHGAMVEDPPNAVFASYLIRFKPIYEVSERYLQYWLRSDEYWNTVRARQSGTTRYNLNAKELAAMPLLWPSEGVLEAFKAQVDPLRGKIVQNVRESQTLGSLRDFLLPKMLSGELTVQEAEREVEESV
jgi:type I restriction enzyme S subunit